MESSLALRVASIFILLVASALGITIPLYSYKSIINDHVNLTIKSLSAGIMIGLALIHLLCEANEMIEENYHDYHALSYALVGVGIFTTVFFEQVAISLATTYARRNRRNLEKNKEYDIEAVKIEIVNDHTYDHSHDHSHDHNHGHKTPCSSCNHSKSHNTLSHEHDHSSLALEEIISAKSIRDIVVAYALEISTAVHSIIIGIDLGMMGDDNYNTIAIMISVLCFHQFVEGFGLGSILRTSKDSLGNTKIMLFMIIFSLTISIGVIIGIGISYGEDETKHQILAKASITSIAAGSLLYTAMSEILPSCFEGKHCEDTIFIKLQLLVAFAIGFASMCIIGIWV